MDRPPRDSAEDATSLRISDLHPHADEDAICAALAAALHPPISCYVVRDRGTGDSLCYGFVNYATRSAALGALRECSFSIRVCGRPLCLSLVRARQSSGSDGGARNYVEPGSLYISNLPPTPFGAADLYALFSHFGTVTRCVLRPSVGAEAAHGFVEFLSADEAQRALALSGLRVGSRSIRVSFSRSVDRQSVQRHVRNDEDRARAIPIAIPSRGESVFEVTDDSGDVAKDTHRPPSPVTTGRRELETDHPTLPSTYGVYSRVTKRPNDSSPTRPPAKKRRAEEVGLADVNMAKRPQAVSVFGGGTQVDDYTPAEKTLLTPAEIQMEMFRQAKAKGRATDVTARRESMQEDSAHPAGDSLLATSPTANRAADAGAITYSVASPKPTCDAASELHDLAEHQDNSTNGCVDPCVDSAAASPTPAHFQGNPDAEGGHAGNGDAAFTQQIKTRVQSALASARIAIDGCFGRLENEIVCAITVEGGGEHAHQSPPPIFEATGPAAAHNSESTPTAAPWRISSHDCRLPHLDSSFCGLRTHLRHEPVVTVVARDGYLFAAQADGTCWKFQVNDEGSSAGEILVAGAACGVTAMAICDGNALDEREGHVGGLAVCGFADRTVRIFRCDNGTCVWDASLESALTSLWVDGHSGRFIAGLTNANVVEMDLKHKALLQRFRGHEDAVTCVEGISLAEGDRVMTTSRDCTARMFDRATGSCLVTFVGHAASVLSMAVAGACLYTGSADCTVRQFSIMTGECTVIYASHGAAVTALRVSPEHVYTTSLDAHLRIFSKGGCLLRVMQAATKGITALDIAIADRSDGQAILAVTGHIDGQLEVMRTTAGGGDVRCQWSHCQVWCPGAARLGGHVQSAHMSTERPHFSCLWAQCGVEFYSCVQLRLHAKAAHSLDVTAPAPMQSQQHAECTRDSNGGPERLQKEPNKADGNDSRPLPRASQMDAKQRGDATGLRAEKHATDGTSGEGNHRTKPKNATATRGNSTMSKGQFKHAKTGPRLGPASFQCDVCQRWFASRANLTNHKTNVHDFLAGLCSTFGLDTSTQDAPRADMQHKNHPRANGRAPSTATDDAYAYDASDPYSVLRLHRAASQADVRRQYRSLALRWHPDRNPDNQDEANRRFKDIVAAYTALVVK